MVFKPVPKTGVRDLKQFEAAAGAMQKSKFRESLFQAAIVVDYDTKFGDGAFSEDFGQPVLGRSVPTSQFNLWVQFYQDAYDAVWNGKRAV